MRIAVVGGGIAGLSAAWTLSRHHNVVLYEAAPRLGGHAHTVDVTLDGRPLPVDVGFMVFNRRNYPNLDALFRHLSVATDATDMSFSASIGTAGRWGACEYRGSALGLAAQPTRLLDPGHWQMIVDILRFAPRARAWLESGPTDRPLADFLSENRFGAPFRQRYLLPMAAAIWSSSFAGILEQPADTFLRFFDNHGLLDIRRRPRWRTVARGSRTYVDRMAETMHADIRTGRAIVATERRPDGVWLRDATGLVERYDQAVFATHADTTLRILASDASDAERRLLGAFRYSANRAVLHRDTGLMPARRAAWASWNYLSASRTDATTASVCVTYWLNNLQNLDTRQPVFLTLNPIREPAPAETVAEFSFDHPQFDRDAIAAQKQLDTIQGHRRAWFCGSYCGHGFHEDALRSGLAVAAALGASPPWRIGADGQTREAESSGLESAA